MTSGAGLVELDLSDNAFGPLGVEGLVELLKSSSCYTLQELRLNNKKKRKSFIPLRYKLTFPPPIPSPLLLSLSSCRV
jgi:hypothetical protein